MNPFGAFNFGRLIKTFLPGFLALSAFALLADACSAAFCAKHSFFAWVKENGTLVTFISIPLSLTAGIILNTVFFTFATDILIRRPYNKHHASFVAFHEAISLGLQQRYSRELDISTEWKEHWDMEYFILPFVPLEKWLFLEENYWYYLEFQLNMILASALGIVAAIVWTAVYFHWTELMRIPVLSILVLASIVVGLVVSISLKGARLNYEKHRRKKLNLFLGSLYTKEKFK